MADITGPLEKATFALNCFWYPEAECSVIPGVMRTKLGYSGGKEDNPTYHNQ